MDWDTYYERTYDWKISTQISLMSLLTSFGASNEVVEVAEGYMDEKAASRLIKKAIAYGVRFTADDICDLSGCCDRTTMNCLLETSECTFTLEHLEELCGSVDDELLELAAKRSHVALSDDDPPEECDEDEWFSDDTPEEKWGKHGLLLGLVIGLFGIPEKKKEAHTGRCNGDCANCPPHYGYRYGRWYYGHHHTHGCEFGGNKCGGGQK